MWRLVFLVISAVMAGESGPEIEYPETPIEYSPLPQEEDMPSPLPGMLYPRESESREVIWNFLFLSAVRVVACLRGYSGLEARILGDF